MRYLALLMLTACSILAGSPQAPPLPQAPPMVEAKASRCDPLCPCGCQEGKPCRCSAPDADGWRTFTDDAGAKVSWRRGGEDGALTSGATRALPLSPAPVFTPLPIVPIAPRSYYFAPPIAQPYMERYPMRAAGCST